MTIIDTHAHIDQVEDLDAAMAGAAAAGVSDIIAVSVDLASMRKVMAIAAPGGRPRVWPALGVHPGKVNEPDNAGALEFLKANIASAAAVGETGLDYWYKWVRKDQAERRKQQDVFGAHLKLAREHDLPIIIHSRGAWKECLAMALSAGTKRAVFHWYSGPLDVQERIIESGYYVSASPSLAYSAESRAALRAAPLGRVLIETDSPVRYRHPGGDYTAQPKDVWKTLEALCALRNLDKGDVLAQVNANARAFFGIPS